MATVTESDVIAGVMLVEPVVHGDERGLFVETFRHEWIPAAREMIQMNRADRVAGCIVGLHYHRFQADYWYVPFGRARVVLHDLRVGSPTEGRTQCVDLGAPRRTERTITAASTSRPASPTASRRSPT